MEEATVKLFDVDDETLGTAIAENLKTFDEAEAAVIAHDKKIHTDWLLASLRDPARTEEFKHHRYLVYHLEGKVVTYADDLAKMQFDELCNEVAGWRTISVVEFKF